MFQINSHGPCDQINFVVLAQICFLVIIVRKQPETPPTKTLYSSKHFTLPHRSVQTFSHLSVQIENARTYFEKSEIEPIHVITFQNFKRKYELLISNY